MTLLQGVILRFNKNSGHGKIKIDGSTREIFFHKDEVGVNSHANIGPGRIVRCQVRYAGMNSSKPDSIKAVNIAIVMEGDLFLSNKEIAELGPASNSNISKAGNN